MLTVGEKVIVRSDSWDESFKVGVFLGYNDIGGKAHKPLPQVEIEGKEYIHFGCCVPYDSELAEELRALTPRQQWNALSNHTYITASGKWLGKGK